ncbi:methyl methanesulfonate sensitivity 4 isoform X2 [Calliopsis andreniformis]|uniref:methyl methanesulfonate sensitivity 4 isoform X2 n=1 Tax=Calliopsis andreniformis TaxID=337506 RepID=UPI003FCC806F
MFEILVTKMSEVIVLSDSNDSVLSFENDMLKNNNKNKEKDSHSDFDLNDFEFPEVHFNHVSNVHQVPKTSNNSNKSSSCNVDCDNLENEAVIAVPSNDKNSKQSQRMSTFSDSTEDSDEEKTRRKKSKHVKVTQKKAKNQLTEEKLERQKQLARDRALKKIALKKSKNIKPGECMKFIEVVLDKGIENFNFISDVISALVDADIQYSIDTELIPNSITWKRIVENDYVNEFNEICTVKDNEKVDQTLLIWNWDETVTKVADNSFCSTICNIQNLLPNNNFILIIFGIEDYFTYRKQARNSAKSGAKNKTQKSNIESNNEYQNFPEISRQQFEECLNKIQIISRCSSRLVNSPQDLALVVYQCTKAVAEIPYKEEKNKSLASKFDWYLMGDNRNSVRVDKDGNGLKRLWQQQLCQFNLSSLEIAEAICSIYPSPVDLTEIRRAAGPLTKARKIGPELSRKIYIMFTSRDGESLLN